MATVMIMITIITTITIIIVIVVAENIEGIVPTPLLYVGFVQPIPVSL